VLTANIAAVVEELWVSDPAPAPATRPAVRAALGPTAVRLLRAEPVPVLPGLHRPTPRCLDELTEPAVVAYLAGARGTVRGAPGPRSLAGVEVVGGSGTAAHVARSLLLAAVDTQGLVADGGTAAPDTEAPAVPVRAELRVDLTDARTRLEQADLWLRLAGAPLGGWYPVGPDRFRLARLLPGPATLTACAGDPDLDRIRVTFVEGADPVTLICYSVEPHPELGTALRDPRTGDGFAAYSAVAADPDADPGHLAELRQRAVATLGVAPAEPGMTPVGESLPVLRGTAVVHDDRALPVGNRVRRFATAVHVLAPDPAATALQTRPEVVAALVDHACATGDAGAGLQQRLAEAVCGPDGDLDAPDPAESGTGLAALVGHPAAVDPDPLGRVTRSLRDLRHRLADGARPVAPAGAGPGGEG
jgi:hypothetical protein